MIVKNYIALLLLLLAPLTASAEFVATTDPSQPTLNLREGPTGSAEIITELQQNTTVEVIGFSGNWQAIRLADGTEGWAYGRYIANDPVDYFPDFSPTHRIAEPEIFYSNLRGGPGTKFAVVGRGYQDDELEATGRREGRWIEFSQPDRTVVWVHASNTEELIDEEGSGEVVALADAKPAPSTTLRADNTSTSEGAERGRFCNSVDLVGIFVCSDRALADMDLAIGIESLKISRTLTTTGARELKRQNRRFAENRARDCAIPSEFTNFVAQDYLRIVACLKEVYRLRQWQLSRRYINIDVTPDDATAADAAPYFPGFSG